MFYGQQSFLKMKPKMKTLSCIFFCFVLTFLVRRKKIFMEEEMRKKKLLWAKLIISTVKKAGNSQIFQTMEKEGFSNISDLDTM